MPALLFILPGTAVSPQLQQMGQQRAGRDGMQRDRCSGIGPGEQFIERQAGRCGGIQLFDDALLAAQAVGDQLRDDLTRWSDHVPVGRKDVGCIECIESAQ